MRYVLVADDDLLWRMLGPTPLGGERPVYVVPRPALAARISRGGGVAVAGDPSAERVYRRAGHVLARAEPEPDAVAIDEEMAVGHGDIDSAGLDAQAVLRLDDRQ